jgi:uncharacterized membrane protein YqiK
MGTEGSTVHREPLEQGQDRRAEGAVRAWAAALDVGNLASERTGGPGQKP